MMAVWLEVRLKQRAAMLLKKQLLLKFTRLQTVYKNEMLDRIAMRENRLTA